MCVECYGREPALPKDKHLLEVMREMGECKLPCHCMNCLHQYRTEEQQDFTPLAYLGEREEKQTIAEAKTYREAIFRDLKALRERIALSSNTIQERWRRKSPLERKAWLLQVRPNIYPHKNPLLVLATPPVSGNRTQAQMQSFRIVHLLPYINLGSLSGDSARLIGLLHHRAIKKPQDWVLFDDKQIQIAWNHGCLAHTFAPGCIYMQGDRYGEWEPFNHPKVHYGDSFGSPRALLVLEAQRYLLEFLRDITGAILENTGRSDLEVPLGCAIQDSPACDKWINFGNSGPRTDQREPGLSSARTLSNQPYSAPPMCDIDAPIEIVESQVAEVQEELWLLQTEPNYFHEKAKRYKEQWLGTNPGTRGLLPTDPMDMLDNPGFGLTIKPLMLTRDWQ